MEEAEYVTGDHCPVIVTLARKNQRITKTRTVRNWKNYSQERLLNELNKMSWVIDIEDVQDYNDEFEQRLMTVVDNLVPFIQKRVMSGQFLESPLIAGLRRRRKNIF